MPCIPAHKIEILLNVFLHVVILSVFLLAFFSLYVAKISKKHMENEVDNIVEDEISKNPSPEKINTFSSILKQTDIDKLKNFNEKIFKSPSKLVVNNNRLIVISSLIVSLFLAIIFVLILVMSKYSCDKCINVKNILMENTVILSVVGLIEFMFFKFVIMKYVPVVPSFMATEVVKMLKQK